MAAPAFPPVSGMLASGVAASATRTLPVGALLAPVLPALQRGTVVACRGDAPVSIALVLVSEACRTGSWVGIAGQPNLGLGAAVDAGVPLERVVAVHGAALTDARWAEVVAAMIDGFDLVVLGPATFGMRPATGRRLHARAQARGAVLVVVGAHPAFQADLQVEACTVAWHGLGVGHGLADVRRLDVAVQGRRVHRPRQVQIAWPAVGGIGREPVPAAVSMVPEPGASDVLLARRSG